MLGNRARREFIHDCDDAFDQFWSCVPEGKRGERAVVELGVVIAFGVEVGDEEMDAMWAKVEEVCGG